MIALHSDANILSKRLWILARMLPGSLGGRVGKQSCHFWWHSVLLPWCHLLLAGPTAVFVSLDQC
jgi:hypothetical protein